LAFKKYDSDKDDLLKFEDFVKIFAPRDSRYRDLVVARKSFNTGVCYHRARCFLPETMHDF